MTVKSKEKIEEFYEAMKERGYTVRADNLIGISEHIISKDNFYHVAINEKVILEAPLDYSIKLVEHELSKLEETPNQ